MESLQDRPTEANLVWVLARGLAGLERHDVEDELYLGLSMTAWVYGNGNTVADARRALVGVRAALLRVTSGADGEGPIPLLGVDLGATVLALAAHVHRQLERAARASGTSKMEVVRVALARHAGPMPARRDRSPSTRAFPRS